MRRAALFALTVAGVALSGCAGKRHDAVVEVRAIGLTGPGTLLVAKDGARANGREAPLEAVAALLPSPLPERIPPTIPSGLPGSTFAAGGCQGSGTVEIVFADGRHVDYGPCGRPASIDRLGGAVAVESTQWAAPTVPAAQVLGARPAEVRAIRRLLRSMAPSRIRVVRLGPVARSWRASAGSVTVHVSAGPTLRGYWEAALLASSYAATAERLHLRPAAVVSTSGGSSTTGVAPERRSIRRGAVDRVAASAGARIVELRHQAAGVAVTVRTARPAAFLKHHGDALMRALDHGRANGGTFVAIEDRDGSVVAAWGGLPSVGMVVYRPDLDSCGPVFHSEPVGASPPPCPAR